MYRVLSISCVTLAAVLAPSLAASLEPRQLVDGLTSSFENVRREAVENAPTAGAPAVLPTAELLTSSSPAVVKAATLALERIAAQAGRPGADAERAAVARELVALLDSKFPTTTRRTALQTLGLVGSDAEAAAIANLLHQPLLAEDARGALDRISAPSATTALIAAISTVSPEVRLTIFDTLARKLGNANLQTGKSPEAAAQQAIQAIKPYAGDPDRETRWRAFEALCRLGVSPSALPIPPAVFSRDDRGRYMSGFLDSAYANIGLGNNQLAEGMLATLAAFPMGDSQACAALIGLAKLQSPKVIEHALGYLAEPEIRAVAIEALSTADIPAINERLAKGLAYTNPSNRVSMLQILAARKAPGVAELLASMRQDPAPDVRVAAFELLGETPADTDLHDAMLKSTPWNREHAGQLYLARAESALASGDVEKARVIFESIASAKISTETRAKAFQGIAQLGIPASQQLVDGAYAALSAPETPPYPIELATAVAQAYAAVHAALPDKAVAEQDLRHLIETSQSPDVTRFALGKLRELGVDSRTYARKKGFVTDWRLLGPFPNAGNSAFGKSFINESEPLPVESIQVDGSTYAWKAISCDAIPAIVDLKATFGGGEDVAVYASADLTCAQETPVALLLGTNDGCEIWVNQSKAFEYAGGRSLHVDGDRIDTVLKPGVNTILIKILQRGGAWGFCLRVVDSQGAPVDTTTLQTTP